MRKSREPDPERRSGGAARAQVGPSSYVPGDPGTASAAGSGAAGSRSGPPPSDQDEPPAPGLGSRARRVGAGGRWWVWVGRAVLWALILVVLFNGIRAPVERMLEPAAPTSATTPDRESGYPTSRASAYALEFAHVYFDYDPASPQDRAARLERYLPASADPQLGLRANQALELQAAQVAGVDARGSRRGVVTLAVLLGQQWMRLAVPVYVNGDSMVISGQPALLPSPSEAKLPPSEEVASDPEVARELRNELPGFFRAYAGSDTQPLNRYTPPGSALQGFSGALRFVSLDDLTVPDEGGNIREITATVTWRLRTAASAKAGTIQQTYQLTVTKQANRWYVRSIRGAPSAGFS